MVLPGVAWYGLVRSGVAWPGVVWPGLVFSGWVFPGVVLSGVVWYCPVWSCLGWPGWVWSGLVFSSLVWRGLVRSGLVLAWAQLKTKIPRRTAVETGRYLVKQRALCPHSVKISGSFFHFTPICAVRFTPSKCWFGGARKLRARELKYRGDSKKWPIFRARQLGIYHFKAQSRMKRGAMSRRGLFCHSASLLSGGGGQFSSWGNIPNPNRPPGKSTISNGLYFCLGDKYAIGKYQSRLEQFPDP